MAAGLDRVLVRGLGMAICRLVIARKVQPVSFLVAMRCHVKVFACLLMVLQCCLKLHRIRGFYQCHFLILKVLINALSFRRSELT
jgi:hypothetical protein